MCRGRAERRRGARRCHSRRPGDMKIAPGPQCTVCGPRIAGLWRPARRPRWSWTTCGCAGRAWCRVRRCARSACQGRSGSGARAVVGWPSGTARSSRHSSRSDAVRCRRCGSSVHPTTRVSWRGRVGVDHSDRVGLSAGARTPRRRPASPAARPRRRGRAVKRGIVHVLVSHAAGPSGSARPVGL